MGHGDEIVFADSNYPAQSNGQRVIRADGLKIRDLLPAVLKLIPLDSYCPDNNFVLMDTNDKSVPKIWMDYESIAKKTAINFSSYSKIDRNAFYERGKRAYAIVATGETETYANILIKKGVIQI